jgi:hypothetical protein
MSRLLSRDPFARQELHRETIDAMGTTCSWCGNVAKGNKLFVYYTERDGIKPNRRTHNGAFCSKSCHDDYHS